MWAVDRSCPAGPDVAKLRVPQITGGPAECAPEEADQVTRIYRAREIPLQMRDRAEIERFFDGLELVDPGVQVVHRWRPDAATDRGATDAQVNIYGGLARKP
jgi:hypothetical protein